MFVALLDTIHDLKLNVQGIATMSLVGPINLASNPPKTFHTTILSVLATSELLQSVSMAVGGIDDTKGWCQQPLHSF